MRNFKFPPWTNNYVFRPLKWLGGFILTTVVLASLTNRVIDYLTGPGAYFVYLVGDFSDKNRQQFRVAFEKEAREHKLKIAGSHLRNELNGKIGNKPLILMVGAQGLEPWTR